MAVCVKTPVATSTELWYDHKAITYNKYYLFADNFTVLSTIIGDDVSR